MSNINAGKEAWKERLIRIDQDGLLPKQFLDTPLTNRHLSQDVMVSGLVKVVETINDLLRKNQKISLRTLSARCFNGSSKCLDGKRQLLRDCIPDFDEAIEARAIMLSVNIPRNLNTVIFVENFDSFRTMVRACRELKVDEFVGIVYSAGYRAAANQIRGNLSCEFVCTNQVNEADYQQFLHWWYSPNNNLPVFFFGDLDLEGVSIVKQLKRSFANVVAMKAMYEILVKYNSLGVGYPASDQLPQSLASLGKVDCETCDRIVIPQLKRSGIFTDQEVLSPYEVKEALKQTFL